MLALQIASTDVLSGLANDFVAHEGKEHAASMAQVTEASVATYLI